MGSMSQTRALKNYRKRLNQRGMARFEVLGLSTDRELIRSLARRLAENCPEAQEIRASVGQVPPVRAKGAAFWRHCARSPLVGADLDLVRSTYRWPKG